MAWHDRVDVHLKAAGFKRPLIEIRSGDDFHRNSGLWNTLERVIDRQGNRYRELIIDPDTGQILRNCDERLSEHR